MLRIFFLQPRNMYRCMRNHSQHNNDERKHFFRKVYLSHFMRKGYKSAICERWVGDWTAYWPPVPLPLAALLFRSAGLLNRGSWGPVLSRASYLQLTELPVAPGYVIVWHPPASCRSHICTQFNPSTVKVIPWYLRPDAPVIYTGAFLIWQLSRGSICYKPVEISWNTWLL